MDKRKASIYFGESFHKRFLKEIFTRGLIAIEKVSEKRKLLSTQCQISLSVSAKKIIRCTPQFLDWFFVCVFMLPRKKLTLVFAVLLLVERQNKRNMFIIQPIYQYLINIKLRHVFQVEVSYIISILSV